MHLIEARKLDGNEWELVKVGTGLRPLARMLEIEGEYHQPVKAVARETDENEKVECNPKPIHN